MLREWTKAEYMRMVEAGILAEDERVELIEGQVLTRTPANPGHNHSITRANMALTEAYRSTHAVRVQMAIDAGDRSLPEPDLALVAHDHLHPDRHPSRVDLVIEVGDSSLRYDRLEKGSLYAKAGIPEFWLINLRSGELEVYTQPGPDPEAPFGAAYRQRTSLTREQSVQPVAVPGRALAVGDMF